MMTDVDTFDRAFLGLAEPVQNTPYGAQATMYRA
jgi:hypothetical protein